MYNITFNNKSYFFRASNAFQALNLFKSYAVYRDMTASEQCSVKVLRVSQWGAL